MMRWLGAALLCFAAASANALPGIDEVPAGIWTQIHEQGPNDTVRFKRQAHGGAAFDSRRGRLILFGSDEHGADWTNSPLFFDPDAREWSRLYPDDDASTYHVNDAGIPVAGIDGDHPWAMHTMGAVVYHARLDALIVSSFPEHLQPGRFTDAMAHVWPAIRRHPTWMLELERGRWKPLAAPAEPFFPYATAYDPGRGVVIGYKSQGVFELSGTPPAWTKILVPGLLGYGNNVAFDTRHDALIVFGSNLGGSDVVLYQSATRRHQRMPTPGLRPPAQAYRPMAFHPASGKTVVLFDRAEAGKRWSETWLYDLGADAWTRLEARLPFALGMNYNLVYDSLRGVLLLVGDPNGGPTGVWALRL